MMISGELVPVNESPRVKPPSKATVSSSNSITSTVTIAASIPAPSAVENNKQFQPFSDNNLFFSKGKQIQFTSTGARGVPQHQQQTVLPPVSSTADHQLLDFVHNTGQPIQHQQTNHIMNQQRHHQPNQHIQQLHHQHQHQQSPMVPQQQQQLHQLHHQQLPIRQRSHQMQSQHHQHHPHQRQSSQQHHQQHHHHNNSMQTNNFDPSLSNVDGNSLFQQGFQAQESQYFKFPYNHQPTANVSVPPSNDQMYNRTGGHNLPYDIVEPNNWNITDNTTTALNVAAASADIDSKDNKMFSLLEMGSPDFMHVDMPQFCKPELSDADLLQYQNLWSTDSTQMDYNSGQTSQQANTYNNIGNILTNLELLGNNSNFDASNFEIITSNYEQQQPLHPQQPQTHQMQPMQKATARQTLSHTRHHVQQQQTQQTHNHHPQQHQHKVMDTGGLVNDANMSYFDIQTAATGSIGCTNSGYSVQNIDTMGRSAMGYQNHTITDISNTFLTENQRNNLQHVSGSGGQFHQQTHNMLASINSQVANLEQNMPSLNDYLQ